MGISFLKTGVAISVYVLVFGSSCRTTSSTAVSTAPKLPSEIKGKTVEEVLYMFASLFFSCYFVCDVVYIVKLTRDLPLAFILIYPTMNFEQLNFARV